MEELKFNIEVNELNVDIILEGLCYKLEEQLTELREATKELRVAPIAEELAVGRANFNLTRECVVETINLINKVAYEKLKWLHD